MNLRNLLKNLTDPNTDEGRIFNTRVGPIMTIIGLLLTIIGLALSIYQTNQATQQANQAIAQEQRITEIANAISTKNIGVFPNNVEAINNMIRNTKYNLWVMTDIPAYGQFSNPIAYKEYREGLDHLANPNSKVDLRLLVYNPERRGKAFEDQFKSVTDFSSFQNSPRFKTYFELWKNKPVPKDKAEFRAMLETEHIDLECRLANLGIEIHETDTTLPLFLWISDEREAIFSFINYPASSSEVVFHTNDQQLINILLEIAKGIYNNTSVKFECNRTGA